MNNKEVRFLTGTSGFLGGEYLEALLEKTDDSAYVLSRSTKADKTIYDRFKSYIGGRVKIVRGDLKVDGILERKEDLERLASEVNVIDNVAGDVSFSQPYEVLENVNVHGTRRILELAKRLNALKRVNLVSTAYTSKRQDGQPVREDEFPIRSGEDYGSQYERSKTLSRQKAQVMLQDDGLKDKVITEFAPGILIGHSQNKNSGGIKMTMNSYLMALSWQILQYHFGGNFEAFKKALDRPQTTKRLDLHLTGDPNSTKYFTCVDAAAEMMIQLDHRPNPKTGEFFYIVSTPLKGTSVQCAIQAAIPFTNIRYSPDVNLMTPLESQIEKDTLAFKPYRFADPFDTTISNELFRSMGYARPKMTTEIFCNVLTRSFGNDILETIERLAYRQARLKARMEQNLRNPSEYAVA